MLGRLRESAQTAELALGVLSRFRDADPTIVANWIEALVACGEWDTADRVSAAAVRAITANYPHHALITRAEFEVGRGEFEAARWRLDVAQATLRLDRDLAIYATFVAELALWERRWADVRELVQDELRRATTRDLAQIRVWLCAKGLRAQAELAALARARQDAAGAKPRRSWKPVCRVPRRSSRCARRTRSRRRFDRGRSCARSGCSRSAPGWTSPRPPWPRNRRGTRSRSSSGLTAREAEVLGLVARGLTNREIASELVISAKTTSRHVSQILRKLDAPKRREAAAIAHRVAPPAE
jgi:DNA-binding CsgD family transcriptional regulator